MKVLFTANIPSPYRVDFFNELGKMVDLTVLYERKAAKNRDNIWLSKPAKYYKEIFLKGLYFKDDSAFSFDIIKYLNDKQYDLVVLGGYSTPSGILSIKYMQLLRRPFLLDFDGGIINKNESKLKSYIKKSLISSANWWTSTGDLTTQYLIHYGAKIERIFIYPFTSIKETDILNNLIDPNTKSDLHEKLEMNEKKIILSVGQFIYRKGYDILLKACEDLDKSIGVYIIGGNPTNEYLKLVEKNSLNNVHFIGFKSKEKLSEYYKAADLFVLPTREDIWGLVINEAMAYGLPIISTNNCGACLEMVVNDENGYIIPVEDQEALLSKIIYLLQNDSIRSQMAKNNIDKARYYTIEKMSDRYVWIFKKILGQ